MANNKLLEKVAQKKASNQESPSLFGDKELFVSIADDSLYTPKQIKYEYLKVSPYNTYGVNQAHVNELASGIASLGLLDFLIVEMVSVVEYHILSGQKRYLAITKLKEELSREDFENIFPGGNIPCRVIDYSKLHLKDPVSGADLSIDNKRNYIIAEGNQQHEKTVSDYMLQIELYSGIYNELKEKNLAGGVRLREFVAEKIGGIQSRSVQKVINAKNNMNALLWNFLKGKDLLESVNQLQEISLIPMDKQNVLYELLQAGTEVDLAEYIKNGGAVMKDPTPTPVKVKEEATANWGEYQQRFAERSMEQVLSSLDKDTVLDPKDKEALDLMITKYDKMFDKAQRLVKKYQKKRGK